MILEIEQLSCGYGKETIVSNFNAQIRSGEVLCLLGPNGVGKTTLFKTVLGLLPAKGGKVSVDGKSLSRMSKKEIAEVIAYVPQAHTPPFPFRVIDVITMGRTAKLGMLSSPGKRDIQAAEEAICQLGIEYLRNKIYTEISGGERQMVLIARALVQETGILMMDEPTSNLDFGNQIKVLDTICRLSNEKGLGILMTTHQPDHAFHLNGRVALMRRGDKYLEGTAEEIITPANMKEAYGVDVCILKEHIDGVNISSCVPAPTGAFV